MTYNPHIVFFLKSLRKVATLLLVFSFFTPGYLYAAGACSQYIGQASLNEFFKDQANQSNDPDDFVEVKILNDSITQTTYENWTLKVCEQSIPANNNDEDGCSGDIRLSAFSDTTKPWIVLKHTSPNFIGKHINLKTGFDATLLDANGDLIDYITVDGYSDAISSITSCPLTNLVLDYTASSPGASDKIIFRSPDGTGVWDSAPSATAPATEDTTNDVLPTPPVGESYPFVTINNISVSTGGTGLFTVSLVDSLGNPTTFSQAVTFAYYSQDGTATVADSDYTAIPIGTPLTKTIAAGQSSVTLSVDATSSNNNDADEYFYFILKNIENSAANGGNPNATISKHFGTATLNGPIGEWTFDICTITNSTTIPDISGNSNNGTALGGVSKTTGKICSAGLFDGTSGYVEIPHNANLNGTTSLTYSAWINPTTWNGGIRQIMSKSVHGGGSGRKQMGIFSESGVLKGRAETSAGQYEVTAPLPSTGSWHHVALVFNGTQLILYVDGVVPGGSSSTTFASTTLEQTTDPLTISKRVGSSQYYFSGSIDEVRVYTRALSAQNISDYYASPNPNNRTCPTCVTPVSQTIILSTGQTRTLKGLSITNGDLTEYNPSTDTASPYFDESSFAGGDENIAAVHVLANGVIILSTGGNATLGGISFGDDDLIAYDPSTNTATLYFDGGAIFSSTNEDITAVYVRDNGNIILSTQGNATINGTSFSDADLVEYNPSTGSATVIFNESTFADGNADIDGVHILSNGNILLSTTENEAIGALSFLDGDIVEYDPSTGTASIYFAESEFTGGADINAFTLPPITTSLHHIQITHDGSALTCEPESITVTACANAACTTPHYPNDVSVTLTPSNANSIWVGGNPKTISGGSSVFQLRNLTTGSPITLSASASTPTTSITPSPSVSCVNSSVAGSTSCDIEFFNSGFIYTVPTQTSCTTSNSITIQAVRLDAKSQTCVPAFQNKDRNLKVWTSYSSPTPAAIIGTPQVTLVNGNGTYTLPTTEPAAANVPMRFEATANETFTVTYPDAGQLVLNTKYEGSAANSDTGLTMLGNSTFVVKPHSYFLEAVYDNSGTEVALNNTSTSGTPIWKASDNFRLRLRGQCQAGTITQNYAPTNAQMFIELTQPATGGTQHSLTIQGDNYISSYSATPTWHNISSKFSSGAITNGVNNYAETAFHEVGVLNLHVRDTQYITAGITLPEQTLTVGRFTPHHFDTTLIHGCAGAGNFTYSGQRFSVTATARNNITPTADITRNYSGALAKNTTFSNSGVTTNFTSNTLTGGVAGDFTNGIGNNTDVTYTFPLKDTPSSLLTLRSVDSDNVSSNTFIEETTDIRSGRARLENVFGPELTALTMPLKIEYYSDNGTATLTDDGFVLNTDDTCTTYDATAGALTNYTGNLSTGETTVTGAVAESNGLSNISFSAPGAGNEGSVNLLANNISSWLTYNWNVDCDNADGDNDITTGVDAGLCGPFGTASFGLYRGDDRIIYWREVF